MWLFCNTLTKLLNRTFCNRTKPYRTCIFGVPFGDPLKLDKIGFGVVYIILEPFRLCLDSSSRCRSSSSGNSSHRAFRQCTRSLPSHSRRFRKLHPSVPRHIRNPTLHVSRTPKLHVAVRSARQGYRNSGTSFQGHQPNAQRHESSESKNTPSAPKGIPKIQIFRRSYGFMVEVPHGNQVLDERSERALRHIKLPCSTHAASSRQHQHQCDYGWRHP